MIDMHCHIDLYPNPHEIVRQCKEKGIYVLSVTTTPKAWRGTHSLADGVKRIRTALGLHPQLAHERTNELELFDAILSETQYVGEVGLEGSRNWKPYQSIQKKVFSHILQSTSRVGGRILSIHSRAAVKEVLDMLERFSDAGIPILHWFTGSQAQLRRALDLGCWFSVGPAMLKTKRGQELAARIHKNRVLTESDGPFVKSRKQILTPLEINIAVCELAKIWHCTVDEASCQVMDNFKSLVASL